MGKAAVLAPPVAPTLQDKFNATEESLNLRLVERQAIIKTALVAMVSKTHVFYLGSPGTAKSLTIRMLRDHIEGMNREDYFEWLLTPFSTDTNIWGPPDLLAMENGVYRTVIDNKMAQAKIAFLDEIWKSNDATLNALLTGLNERIFHNDVIVPMPLMSLYCASNELPQSTELEAIYDRIHFRHQVKPIQGSSGFVQMLKNRTLGPVTPTLHLDDIVQAQAEAAAVTISDEVFDALRDLRGDLKAESVEPTDRRWSECLPVIQATAWFRGATEAEIDDVRLLRFMLAHDPTGSEQPIVDSLVTNLASPLEAKAMELRDRVGELAEAFDKIMKDSDNETQKNHKAIELHTKLDRAAEEALDIEKQIATGGRSSEIVNEIKVRITSMTDVLLEKVFHIDPELINR